MSCTFFFTKILLHSFYRGRVRRSRDIENDTLVENEVGPESIDPDEDKKEVSVLFSLGQTFGFDYLYVAALRLVFSSLLCVSPLILKYAFSTFILFVTVLKILIIFQLMVFKV